MIKDKMLPYTRGPQILKALAEYGPLSVRGLTEIILPLIPRRSLLFALGALEKKKLIKRLNYRIFRGAGVFYRINDDEKLAETIAGKLGVPIEQLNIPKVLGLELLHSEGCAVLCERLRRELPGARVIREFSYSRIPAIESILLTSKRDLENRPDILILLKGERKGSRAFVGVELERIQKSRKRIAQKIHKYAAESRLDGVIYFCEEDSIGNRIRHIYQTKVLKRSIRIRHYGDDFLLFGRRSVEMFPSTDLLFNSAGRTTSLRKWIGALVDTPHDLRRDTDQNI